MHLIIHDVTYPSYKLVYSPNEFLVREISIIHHIDFTQTNLWFGGATSCMF